MHVLWDNVKNYHDIPISVPISYTKMSGLHFTSVNQKVYTAPLKFAKRNMFPVILFILTFIILSAQANVQFDIINKERVPVWVDIQDNLGHPHLMEVDSF